MGDCVLHDAFGTSGMKNLVEVLKGAGVEPMLIQGYSNNSPDFTPVAFAVKQSGADVMGTYMPFSPDLGIFARQLRQLGVNIACVGSPSTLSRAAVRLAGPALTGCYAVSDFAADLLPAQMPRALHSIGLNFLGACRTFLLRFSAHNGTIRGLSSFLNPPRREFSILNGMTGCRIVLAAVLSMLSCFGRATEPLKIGMVAPLTGPAAESGRYQTQGAKLAGEEVNKAGGVLGRPIELVIEDDQTTNPGIVLAFSKLAGDKDIPAFIGSVRSTQVHAMAPDIQKLGKPVMIGGTDPQLTHMGNPWLFRFRPNDSYSARVVADYGVKTLGKKKWAIVHSTDAFGTNGMKNLVEDLKAMGIEPALVQGYTNNCQDFTPVVLAVKQSGADVMNTYMTFETDVGIFARQLRQLGVNNVWVGSPSIATTTALKLAGPALAGSYAVADFNRDSSSAAKEFAAKYEVAYKSTPDLFSAWPYDAVHVLAFAINNAKSLDPQRIREALLSVKDYPGAEGPYNFDQNGDGLHGYNVVKNDNGKIVFIKHIDFSE